MPNHSRDHIAAQIDADTPVATISDEEKARRQKIVEQATHSLRLEGMERSELSTCAAKLWINGKITMEEKSELVRASVRDLAGSRRRKSK